jgi:hypothetical protein
MQLSSMQGESLRVDEPKAPLSIKLKTLDVSHSKTRSKADCGQRGKLPGLFWRRAKFQTNAFQSLRWNDFIRR